MLFVRQPFVNGIGGSVGSYVHVKYVGKSKHVLSPLFQVVIRQIIIDTQTSFYWTHAQHVEVTHNHDSRGCHLLCISFDSGVTMDTLQEALELTNSCFVVFKTSLQVNIG